MYGYAQDIDLIQDGQLSEVRMHGERTWLLFSLVLVSSFISFEGIDPCRPMNFIFS